MQSIFIGGIRQVYQAGIGEILKNLKKAQIINFDLGIGDPVTPAPKKLKTPSLLSQNGDLSWSVYPIERFSDALRNLDTTRLEKGWPSATASVPHAPKFSSAFAMVLKLLAELERK